MATVKPHVNNESAALPAYLQLGRGKFYGYSDQNVPKEKPAKTFKSSLQYGVSADAPSDFMHNKSMINYSSKKYDPHGDFGLRKTEGNEPKDRSKKSQKTQKAEQQVNMNQSFSVNTQGSEKPLEVKPRKTVNNFDCILNQNEQINPPNEEVYEKPYYKEFYYQQYNTDQKPFNKKKGYFLEYNRRNKIILDQYKENVNNSFDHNRYQSRPVFFTTGESKNNRSHCIAEDHKMLLTTIKTNQDRVKTNQRPTTGSQGPDYNEDMNILNELDEAIEQARKKRGNQRPDTASQSGPTKSKRYRTNRTQSPAILLKDNLSFSQRPQSAAFTFQKLTSTGRSTSEKRKDKYQSIGHTVDMNNSYSAGVEVKSSIESRPMSVSLKFKQKFLKKFDPYESRSTKYGTKMLDTSINAIQQSDGDSDGYLLKDKKWTNAYQNQINLKLLQEVKQEIQRKGQIQNYQNPKTFKLYTEKPLNENTVIDFIDEFDDHFKQMSREVPYLGKQRWCYDMKWKYKLDYKKKREEMLKKQEEEERKQQQIEYIKVQEPNIIIEESTQKEKTAPTDMTQTEIGLNAMQGQQQS